MNDIFHISKLLIKKKLRVLTGSDKSQLKKFNKEYTFIEEVKIEKLVDKMDSYATINKERAWESIEKKIEKRKVKPVTEQFSKTWNHYAAAAIFIGILATTYFFKDNISKKPLETNPATIISATDRIEPGTDKATLTLEDGTVVTLEKGNTYQTQNANSNGHQIVYNAEAQNADKVAFNYLSIPRGGQFFIKLSDGTEVWLNSESQLKYPVNFKEGETRKVELVYGEAYFKVTPSSENKGSNFIVYNQSQEIEVLGTQFNLKAYRDESHIYTTLVEGKVAISSSGKHQKLLPNQQSNLDLVNKHISIIKVDVYAETSWRNGIFSFREKPLKDIMKVISRWYDVDVVFENKELENITFKGVLGKNQDLQEILETIKSLSIIKNYEINGKQIILK